MADNNITNAASEFQVITAEISTTRSDLAVDIKSAIVEFIIYEHIEKPYLTMDLVFKDQHNIVQDMDFQGAEKLSIKVQHIEQQDKGKFISAEFVIDKIIKTFKIDERQEAVTIHCTEYHAYESLAQNVNMSYSGSPSGISQRIIQTYLNKDLVVDGQDAIRDMKVVIPNMHPLEAVMWLTPRMTTHDGLPFFFYSPMGVQNLVLKDLQKMLEQQPINAATPYMYAPSMETNKTKMNLYLISKYRHESSENLLRRIAEGVVGAQYHFIDTYNGVPERVNFDVDNVFKSLLHKNLLGGSNKRYGYSPGYEVKDTPLSQHSSKVISRVSSSGAYQNLGVSYRSYDDETVQGNQTKTINRKALKSFLTKSPLSITVKGREFIIGDNNYTLGKTIRVQFLDTKTEVESGKAKLDQKKSGDYIVMGAKHIFASGEVESELLIGKVASLGEDADAMGAGT